MPNRPQPNYNCTQLELYAVCRITLSSYRENIPDFTNFKGFYDSAWGNQFEAEINAAATLPAFQTRDEKSETARILLDKKAKDCGNKWQDLSRYIDSVQGWEELQKPKQEAAGSTLYQQATHGNWEVMKGLMETGESFIANNLTSLTANNNMPPAFQNQFTTLKQDYILLYDELTDKTQDQEQETDTKILKNNAINTKLSGLNADGQAINRNNPSMADRFTFTQVLKIVRGSKGKTKTIEIPPADKKTVDRIVTDSQITNEGEIELLIDKGQTDTPSPKAVKLPPETSIPVPNNAKEITIHNQHPETPGQATVRVTTD